MSMADIDRWVEDWRAELNSDPDELLQHIASLLKNETTPKDVAQRVTLSIDPIIRAKDTPATKACVWRFWDFVMSAVREFGMHEEINLKLACFLDALSQLEVTDDDGKPILGEGHERYWLDLPGWGSFFWAEGVATDDLGFEFEGPPESTEDSMVTDPDDASTYDMNVDICPFRDAPDNEEYSVALRQGWVNANKFAATSVAISPHWIQYYGHAVMSMNLGQSLEEDAIWVTSEEQSYYKRLYIISTTAWIQMAGIRIYNMCHTDEYGGELHPENWGEWKEQLKSFITDGGSADKNLGGNAVNAVRKMETLEKSAAKVHAKIVVEKELIAENPDPTSCLRIKSMVQRLGDEAKQPFPSSGLESLD